MKEAMKAVTGGEISQDNVTALVNRQGTFFVRTPKGFHMVRFSTPEEAEREFDTLVKLEEAGVPAPIPSATMGDLVVVELVDGVPAVDIISPRELDDTTSAAILFRREILEEIAKWLAVLHKAFMRGNETLVKGRADLNNFLVTDESTIMPIDFGGSSHGKGMEDVGEVVASILFSEPMFTDLKFGLASGFVEAYIRHSGIMAPTKVELYTARALRDASTRMPAKREILIEMADWIQKSGLVEKQMTSD